MSMAATTTSTLLLLPRDVRERIWIYAYGDLVLHAEPANPDQKERSSGYYSFKYLICQHTDPISDAQTMLMSCPEGGTGPASQHTPFFWPVVSRQFWSETTNTLYKSATFKVDGSINLYILASSQQQSVRRMRNLEIRLGLGIRRHNRIWSPARCQSMIKKFESLRGLSLLVGMVVDDDTSYTGTIIDYTLGTGERRGVVTRASRLEGRVWQEENNRLPVFVRAFQQHNLQPEFTKVVVIDRRKVRPERASNWHPKDRRWQGDPYSERQNDNEIQETRKQELAASLRALLLGQDIKDLFPDWELENEQLLAEQDSKYKH